MWVLLPPGAELGGAEHRPPDCHQAHVMSSGVSVLPPAPTAPLPALRCRCLKCPSFKLRSPHATLILVLKVFFSNSLSLACH